MYLTVVIMKGTADPLPFRAPARFGRTTAIVLSPVHRSL